MSIHARINENLIRRQNRSNVGTAKPDHATLLSCHPVMACNNPPTGKPWPGRVNMIDDCGEHRIQQRIFHAGLTCSSASSDLSSLSGTERSFPPYIELPISSCLIELPRNFRVNDFHPRPSFRRGNSQGLHEQMREAA